MQEEYLKIQNALKDKVVCKDRFDISYIRTVGGVDLAYWKENDKEYAVCCIVIIDVNTHNVIEKQYCSDEITVPYIPGFLSFREFPLIAQTVKLLKNIPDIYMFDGNGYFKSEYCSDRSSMGMHFTYPGCAAWVDYLYTHTV